MCVHAHKTNNAVHTPAFFFSGSLHLRSRMHITTAVHSINTFCIFTKLLTTISMCIKHLNRHRHARISGYLLLTTLWCTVPPLHVYTCTCTTHSTTACIYIYMYLWLTLLVLCGSLTCTGLPIVLCTVTRGNSGWGGIWSALSSALYTRAILKTFMGCNAKVRLCPFHVSAAGLNCLLWLAHW